MFNILWITRLLSDRCILRSLPTKLHWNSKFYSSMNFIPLSMYVSCLPKALFASIILPLLDINPSIFGEGFIPKNEKFKHQLDRILRFIRQLVGGKYFCNAQILSVSRNKETKLA